ncbi:hypothetical protein L3C95_29105 [Chitinophaga filiformis]|uniref:hypothetical protein n=1 Tax=Chitinophaga filiformis TaxID=104663 RepID=UPI001F2DE66F|nr:hypothetical protein [Chitinophaga filiformis]MCF6406993.1 hypothetical protein [Chitinophaga filiformis]
MQPPEQTNFYLVSQDLSVTKCESFEDCITYEDFFYVIKEVTNHINRFNVELLSASGDKFVMEENGWKVTAIKAELLLKGSETAQIYVSMMIADSLGNVDVISANRAYYKGIVQLHQRLRYLSLSSDWNTANKRNYHISLKNIFTRIKNSGTIHYYFNINPDEDYSINLSFKKGLFVMSSCIRTGDFLMEYRNEEVYTNADFYQFIKFVLKKFPEIDLRGR